MSMHSEKPMVPLADRLHHNPEDYRETAQETVWFNPENEDAVIDVYVGCTPQYGPRDRRPRLTRETRTGFRTYVVKAGEERAIPSEFDQAIQTLRCEEPGCISRPFYCKDHTHRKTIFAGLATKLIHRGMQHRPKLHYALDVELANYKESVKTAADAAAAAAKLVSLQQVAAAEAVRFEEKVTEPSKPASGATASPKKDK